MTVHAAAPALLPLTLLLLLRHASAVGAPADSEGPPAAESSGVGAAAAALGEDDECSQDEVCALQALQLRRSVGRAARGLQDGLRAEAEELEALETALGGYAVQVPLDLPQRPAGENRTEPAGETCRMTALKLRYGAQVGVFGLPGNASVGTLVRHSCEFEGATYPHGEVTFECRSDRWHYKSDDCALCPDASLPIEAAGASGVVSLKRATRAGQLAEARCRGLKGDRAAYRYGTLSFACQENGTWALENETCSVCPASKFNLSYGGDPGLFELPPAPLEGMQVERPCSFQRQKFPVGSVKFSCEAGAWKFASDSCATCTATNLTVKDGDAEGVFELPRTTSMGGSFWRPCTFGSRSYKWGSVNFECGEKGWTFTNLTCAACPASKPFNVTYGADVGVFQLPSAASEGEVNDSPCVFGATNYSSGVVRFVCQESQWHLRTVTCVDGESVPAQSTAQAA